MIVSINSIQVHTHMKPVRVMFLMSTHLEFINIEFHLTFHYCITNLLESATTICIFCHSENSVVPSKSPECFLHLYILTDFKKFQGTTLLYKVVFLLHIFECLTKFRKSSCLSSWQFCFIKRLQGGTFCKTFPNPLKSGIICTFFVCWFLQRRHA